VSEQGPFDRILDPAAQRDRTARLILVGMGVVGVILLLLVLLPGSLLGGGGDDGGAQTGGTTNNRTGKAPKAPEGFEALSLLLKVDAKEACPCDITLPLLQPTSDGRNLALYTSRSGKWERLSTATLVEDGSAAKGRVDARPANVAVLRRVVSAVQVSGWLPAGADAEPEALDVLGAINPVDFLPNADGTLAGTASTLPDGKGSVMPTVRAATQKDIDAVNAILASPALREAHVNALVQLAVQPAYAGIDIDYRGVNPARRADFTAFVTALADRLDASNRSLSVTLPTPVKTGVSWDTGAYDWDELGRRADALKLMSEQDPANFYKRMEEVLNFLKERVELKKVALVLTRQSVEKGSDGLRLISLHEGLGLASEIEVRTTSAITPNASVIIVGKNIFQDDGASGLRWDESAFAVSFSYPGRGGQRTVWLENSLSIAFRVDLARRFGLGGVAIDDVSLNPQAPAVWDTLRAYVETGSVTLAQPNGVLLRPAWQIQAGSSEPGSKGNVVWRAPAQTGDYDVSLIVSDGVIRAAKKVVLRVQAGGATPAAVATPTATPRP